MVAVQEWARGHLSVQIPIPVLFSPWYLDSASEFRKHPTLVLFALTAALRETSQEVIPSSYMRRKWSSLMLRTCSKSCWAAGPSLTVASLCHAPCASPDRTWMRTLVTHPLKNRSEEKVTILHHATSAMLIHEMHLILSTFWQEPLSTFYLWRN